MLPVRFALFALTLATPLGCGPDPVDSPTGSLRLCVQTAAGADATAVQERVAPAAAQLSRALGVSVEFVPVPSQTEALGRFVRGELDLAWFDGLTALRARHSVRYSRALVTRRRDAARTSVIVAFPDNDLRPSDMFPIALAGRRFAFGATGSGPSRLWPELFVHRNTTKHAREFFSGVHFSGSDARTLELVSAGDYDAGVVASASLAEWNAGRVTPSVRSIWTTPAYPEGAFWLHPRVDRELAGNLSERLENALVDLRDPQHLAAFGSDRLVRARDADYQELIELAVELRLLQAELGVIP